MSITISVSERTERIIREKAEQKGKDVAEFVGEFIEEKFAGENGEEPKRKHNLLKFAGMFSGGDGKTSENYRKILREEIDSAAGFTTDRGE